MPDFVSPKKNLQSKGNFSPSPQRGALKMKHNEQLSKTSPKCILKAQPQPSSENCDPNLVTSLGLCSTPIRTSPYSKGKPSSHLQPPPPPPPPLPYPQSVSKPPLQTVKIDSNITADSESIASIYIAHSTYPQTDVLSGVVDSSMRKVDKDTDSPGRELSLEIDQSAERPISTVSSGDGDYSVRKSKKDADFDEEKSYNEENIEAAEQICSNEDVLSKDDYSTRVSEKEADINERELSLTAGQSEEKAYQEGEMQVKSLIRPELGMHSYLFISDASKKPDNCSSFGIASNENENRETHERETEAEERLCSKKSLIKPELGMHSYLFSSDGSKKPNKCSSAIARDENENIETHERESEENENNRKLNPVREALQDMTPSKKGRVRILIKAFESLLSNRSLATEENQNSPSQIEEHQSVSEEESKKSPQGLSVLESTVSPQISTETQTNINAPKCLGKTKAKNNLMPSKFTSNPPRQLKPVGRKPPRVVISTESRRLSKGERSSGKRDKKGNRAAGFTRGKGEVSDVDQCPGSAEEKEESQLNNTGSITVNVLQDARDAYKRHLQGELTADELFREVDSTFDRRRHSSHVTSEYDASSAGTNGISHRKRLKGNISKPQPFKLRTEERGQIKEQEFAKKIAEMLAEEERLRIPIAQGLPWTTDEPEVLPKLPVKEPTIPVEFHLVTAPRAVERTEFDQYIAEKLACLEQQRLEEERLRKIMEEEEIKRMRKEMVPRAQMMPYFDRPFVPKRSSKSLTIPKEPNFHHQQRKRAKVFGNDEEESIGHRGSF